MAGFPSPGGGLSEVIAGYPEAIRRSMRPIVGPFCPGRSPVLPLTGFRDALLTSGPPVAALT